MGVTPFHHRTWQSARRTVVLATVLALVIAPLVVIATHGPGAHAAAAATSADLAGEASVPGHAHDHAGHDHEGGAPGAHNPADHDHPLQALLCQAASALEPSPETTRNAHGAVFRHLAPDGPRRPPRIV